MKKVAIALTTCYLLLATVTPVQAQALPRWVETSPGCTGVNATIFSGGNVTSTVDAGDVATIKGLECVVSNLLNVAITLIGFAVLIMFVIGSYQLMFSGGDPKAISAGRNTITYALLGLILAIGVWFILNLITAFTGADVTEFSTQIDS